LIQSGLGLVLKVVDGGQRAVPPAVLALFGQLGALDETQVRALAPHARISVRNHAGTVVGGVAAFEFTAPII
jgi:L-asparaginase II